MNPSDQTLQSLDQIRIKLQLLTTSLQSLHHRILSTPTLPPFPVLQSSISVTLTQLSSLTDSLSKHASQLNRVVVTPALDFPVPNKEGLLTTLLRTKVLPDTESYLQPLTSSTIAAPGLNGIKDDEMGEVVGISEWFQKRRDRYNFTGYLTRIEQQEQKSQKGIGEEGLSELRRMRKLERESRNRSMAAMLRYSRSGR